MIAKHANLQQRTKQFALRILRLVEALPKTDNARAIGRQLARSGTSVAANYRAACFAKSRRDFVLKMRIVAEECDESVFWMELLCEGKILKEHRLSELMAEGHEILAIAVASIKTARSNEAKESSIAKR